MQPNEMKMAKFSQRMKMRLATERCIHFGLRGMWVSVAGSDLLKAELIPRQTGIRGVKICVYPNWRHQEAVHGG